MGVLEDEAQSISLSNYVIHTLGAKYMPRKVSADKKLNYEPKTNTVEKKRDTKIKEKETKNDSGNSKIIKLDRNNGEMDHNKKVVMNP